MCGSLRCGPARSASGPASTTTLHPTRLARSATAPARSPTARRFSPRRPRPAPPAAAPALSGSPIRKQPDHALEPHQTGAALLSFLLGRCTSFQLGLRLLIQTARGVSSPEAFSIWILLAITDKRSMPGKQSRQVNKAGRGVPSSADVESSTVPANPRRDHTPGTRLHQDKKVGRGVSFSAGLESSTCLL